MKVGIIGSMQFSENMVDTRDKLMEMGHDAFITALAPPFIGKSVKEKEKLKKKQRHGEIDTIREFWELMQDADAVLVINLEKSGIPNYIGANTLMEIGFAHVLRQKIFLFNKVPNIPYIREEIEAVHPVIINGDLSKIR